MRFSTICLMFCVSGCLRPVWTELPRTMPVAPVPVTRAEPAEEAPELFVTEYDDEDRYRVEFSDLITHTVGIYLYVTIEDYYRMDCDWQGSICTSTLPREARHAVVLLIREKHRRCPAVRLVREGERLELRDPFITGCGFMLGDPL